MISGFYILWGFACGFKNLLSYFSTAFVLGNMLNKAGRCPPAEYEQGALHSLPVRHQMLYQNFLCTRGLRYHGGAL